jgi:beta-xylosidase
LPNAPVGAAAGPIAFADGDTSALRVLDFPDPFILPVANPPVDGVTTPEHAPPPPTYYAYATGSGFATLQVASSTDLVHWTWRDDPFTGPDPSAVPPGDTAWATTFAHTWGPAVIERPANPDSARFVMYYASRSKAPSSANFQCIGRATSASPLGPFVDSSTTPMLCTPDRGGSIDPNPVVAADGSLVLLWKSEGTSAGEPTRLWSTPLTPDGLTLAGQSTELLETLGWSWEPPIIEGPSVMPAPGGGYLLFYSASTWQTADYKSGVAWCQNLTTPCVRLYATPVLATRGTMAGPGGGSAFQGFDGVWRMVFHAWTSPDIGYVAGDPSHARSMRLLPITFPAGGHNPQIG